MAKTEFGVNHPLAVKVWSKKLMTEAIANTWIGKFIGNSKDSLADSDEAAQAFRFDDALCSGMMAPRALSLAG
jgi:hypothetical protein